MPGAYHHRAGPNANTPRMTPRGGSPAVNGHAHLPDARWMSGREQSQIVRSQMRAVETGDTFADDYYFLTFQDRKRKGTLASSSAPLPTSSASSTNNKDRPAETLKYLRAVRSGTSTRPLGSLGNAAPRKAGPLPELGESRTVLLGRIGRSAESLRTKSREWVKANSVLGRSTKSNLRTPRELVELHDAAVVLRDGAGEHFASGEWQLRASAAVVADLVTEIEDVARVANAVAATAEERAAQLGAAGPSSAPGWELVTARLQALEAQQLALSERLAEEMGLSGKHEDDDARLLRLLWLPKGRRAMTRAVRCLLPEHVRALLHSASRMLVYFVCTSPDGRNSDNATEREKAKLDESVARLLVDEFNALTLAEVCTCVELLLASQTPESLRAVMATPGGAEVVRGIIVHGQELADVGTGADEPSATGEADAKAWTKAFDAFLAMAEAGIAAKEQMIGGKAP